MTEGSILVPWGKGEVFTSRMKKGGENRQVGVYFLFFFQRRVGTLHDQHSRSGAVSVRPDLARLITKRKSVRRVEGEGTSGPSLGVD